jgi:toxin-antitoxin system PIN domain toxin
MIRGVDTDVLVKAQIAGDPQHARVRAVLASQLLLRHLTLAVTPLVLAEFVHVVTDPRRFEPPLSMEEAIAVSRIFLGRSNVVCLEPTESTMQLAMDLLVRHRLGRKRVADTLLAATYLTHGVSEILTCNPRDFARFEGLSPIDACSG